MLFITQPSCLPWSPTCRCTASQLDVLSELICGDTVPGKQAARTCTQGGGVNPVEKDLPYQVFQLVGVQPPTNCSFARHLVGKIDIHCSFAHH